MSKKDKKLVSCNASQIVNLKDKKRVPYNTSQKARELPMVPLAGAIILGAGESILRQEKQGQRSFVNSETLPTDMGRYSKYNVKEILEDAGIKFLGEVEGDPMFQYVELPTGWKKLPTDHSMHSKLVDEKGRERANIFYKAAFYDRSANLSLSTRFNFRLDYDRREKEGVAVAHVTDGDNVIHSTEPIKLPDDNRKQYEVSEKAHEAAIAWLNRQYPDWKNPGAYWD